MGLDRLFLRLPQLPVRIARESDLRSRLATLQVANKYGRSPITHPGGPIVSLTTHGERAQTVHLAIESIGRGQLRPSRLILWLDDQSLLTRLSAGLRRLQTRGLEVKRCENYGPHKKYYPYIESHDIIDAPLVTADDDLIYPQSWLRDLMEAFQHFPDVVNCHRARVMILNDNGIAKYDTWEPPTSTVPSFRHFSTGVAGAIYPPSFLRALKTQATAFLSCCPRADDIWLHLQALRSGHKVRQVNTQPFRLRYIPGTQSNGLLRENLSLGGNDVQIEATYQLADIAKLRQAESII